MCMYRKLQLEQTRQESGDFACSDHSLIVGIYVSGVFDAVEIWHFDTLGDITGWTLNLAGFVVPV